MKKCPSHSCTIGRKGGACIERGEILTEVCAWQCKAARLYCCEKELCHPSDGHGVSTDKKGV